MAFNQTPTTGTLVWAKVEPYPWWPGRIVKSIYQQRQQVFKIAFFADPTYTYLHQHQILPLDAIDPNSNPDIQHHPSLQKAVKMAYNYQNKLQAIQQAKVEAQLVQVSSSFSLPQKTEEFRLQNSILSSEREVDQPPSQPQESQSMISEPSAEEITSQNVLKLLENLSKKSVKTAYCYERRKEEIRYQDKLKQHLLKRYNLISFDEKGKKVETQSSPSSSLQKTVISELSVPEKKQKKIRKSTFFKRSLINDQIEELTKRCTRKIHTILKNSQDSCDITRQSSMEIMKRMLVLADNNQIKLKSLFVTLVKTMSSSSRNINCEEQLSDFRHYLERLEGEKGEDEEGSKVTQITQIDTALC